METTKQITFYPRNHRQNNKMKKLILFLLCVTAVQPTFARVGDSLEQLKKRYGEPVATKEVPPFTTVTFKVKDFTLVSYFKGKEDKVKIEIIVLSAEASPEVVVQKIAGDARVVPYADRTISSMVSSGIIPKSIIAMWSIYGDPQTFVVYEGSSDSGGALVFSDSLKSFPEFFKAISAGQADGL